MGTIACIRTPTLGSPSAQKTVAGIRIAFSAGVFVSLNLLGAGGGRPGPARIVQITNAILSSVWFLSALVGGTYLNLLGPGITMCFGICTYALYVGSLWYYEAVGRPGIPLAAGAIIGVGAGAVFVTSGYIQVAYSSENNKGRFIAVQNTLQGRVPPAVYITFITFMLGAALLAVLTLRRPHELSSTGVDAASTHGKRALAMEVQANLAALKARSGSCLSVSKL